MHLENPVRFNLTRIKTRAKKKGLPFDITPEDIYTPEVCPYLGIPLFAAKGAATDNSPSLDRIKPELGYVKGNIEVISHLANRMKNKASIEQMVKFAEAIIERYKI